MILFKLKLPKFKLPKLIPPKLSIPCIKFKAKFKVEFPPSNSSFKFFLTSSLFK